MKSHVTILFLFALLAVAHQVHAAEHTPPREASRVLVYSQPARVWTEALPVGNGRLGAMVFGTLAEERLQLNEDTLWTGKPHDYSHEGAVEVLPELRRLLREGKQKEAEALAMQRFMSVPLRQMAYQPLADLRLAFAGHERATDYARRLDLDRAIVETTYRVDGVRYTRETLSSHPHQVVVHRVSADRRGAVNVVVRLDSQHKESKTVRDGADGLRVEGNVQADGLRFAGIARVVPSGGRLSVDGSSVKVEGADAVLVLFAAGTSYRNVQDISGDPLAGPTSALSVAAGTAWEALRDAHLADHRKLFRRMTIDLGGAAVAGLTTHERLAVADKTADPALAALLFNFGRYLLVASSRPGTQPANLQGIWNDRLDPPWGSKYTTNINAEMNYWPAEVANLAECHEPFFTLIDEVVESGRRTAQVHYGASGWVLHHNTDLWRGTAPINNSNHGIWPTGGAWLCLHLWERWRYSGDREFLERRVYPILKDAARFFLDTLVLDEKSGFLISGPSNSPEHGGLVMGPTMDHQIIRGLFTWTAEAARELGVDEAFAIALDAVRERIAPNRIGRLGQLQEWMEDVDDPNNRHRHVSHLWGVFPGEDITWETPDVMRAAQRSLELRGDGGTGWSLGWKISLWARFLDGDHAHRILMNQLTLVEDPPDGSKGSGGGGTYPNLFDAHPPFQIDGNFAATAGVCEMLVQSHRVERDAANGDTVVVLDLLPALPSAWPDGFIRGVRARGGFELELAWRGGRLVEAIVHSKLGKPAILRLGKRIATVALPAGATGRWDGELTSTSHDRR
ncbi:glycoside hydrolase family 95 protein [Opitutales bacterium ASA1]|uniref:glycoside hydrolase family 95 protein n=1 Tax=Congregicoccus parvus TaxID=3081749 RepID=UPI002B2F26FC|nr:glycoside hydrolase family 95 protein [Opitutales bacterium ASA1]